MSENPYSAPKASGSRETRSARTPKIRPLWRGCVAIVALAIAAFEYVGYQMVRSINGHYFKDYGAPSLGALDILGILVAVYLLLVALFGRWLLFPRGK